jgi:glycerate kinase
VLVVIAPDSYGGTLSAVEAAAALGLGWSRGAPHDTLDLVPLSDGGPGFVDVLAGCLPEAQSLSVTVSDPLGRPTPAVVLLHGGHGGTAYVESAQACGLHLLAPAERDPLTTGTRGVGELLQAAVQAGARRIVVGLGGSATNDAGLGLLESFPSCPPGVQLVVASDVDAPLLGPHGATATFGEQKLDPGLDPAQRRAVLARLEERMVQASSQLARRAGRELSMQAGAGAAGGLGAALLALGATREPGIALVMAAVGLRGRLQDAGLVVTGEGSYDHQSLRGKVPNGVTRTAQAEGVPCVVIAGVSAVGMREARSHGIDEIHTAAAAAGSAEASRERPGHWLAVVAEQVARQWSPARLV